MCRIRPNFFLIDSSRQDASRLCPKVIGRIRLTGDNKPSLGLVETENRPRRAQKLYGCRWLTFLDPDFRALLCCTIAHHLRTCLTFFDPSLPIPSASNKHSSFGFGSLLVARLFVTSFSSSEQELIRFVFQRRTFPADRLYSFEAE